MLPNTSFSDHMGLDCIYQQQEDGEPRGAAGEGILELNAQAAVMFKQVRSGEADLRGG